VSPSRSKFGLTTSYPKAVEDVAHDSLDAYRLPGREFFEVSVGEAVGAVQAAAGVVAGHARWAVPGVEHIIGTGDRIALATEAGQLFLHVHYPDPQAVLYNRPEIADIWQAHTDGDILELMATHDGAHVISFGDDNPNNNWTDPVPFIDRAGTFPNATLNGKERARPGDRIIWLTLRRGAAVFQFAAHSQVISRTRHLKTLRIDGRTVPLLLIDVTYEELPADLLRSGHIALTSMTPPRCWAPRHGDDTGGEGRAPQPPEYWMPALNKPRRRRR
jgi:hypothetical protein